MPILTAVVAFLDRRRSSSRATGHNPLDGLPRHLQRRRPELVLPPDDRHRLDIAAYNLQQTLLQTTTLILTGLAVAFAFRCGMFNIGGQGQYFVGPYVAIWVGTSWARHGDRCLHVAARDRRRDARRRGLGGHRRLPEGDRRRARGDLDDHAQLDRDLGRHVPVRRTAARCRTTRTRSSRSRATIADEREAAGVLGRQELQGLSHRLLHRARRARRLLAHPEPHDARLRGARGRLQPRGGALRRHQRRARTTDPRDGDLGRVRRARRRRSTCSASSTGSASPTSRSRSIGFLGIAVALLGRNTAVGVGLAALLFGALLFGTTHGLAVERRSTRSSPSNLTLHHPGADRALRRRRRAHPLRLEQRAGSCAERPRMTATRERIRGPRRRADRRAARGRSAIVGIVLGVARVLARRSRRSRRARSSGPLLVGILAIALRHLGGHARRAAARLGRGRRGRRSGSGSGSSRPSRAPATSTRSSGPT